MSVMRPWKALACALLLGATWPLGVQRLCGQDIDVNDLRLGLGELSTHSKQASPQVVDASGPETFTQGQATSNHREQLSYQHIAFGSGGGLLLGVYLGLGQARVRDSDHTNDFDTLVIGARVGYALRLNDEFHVEATLDGGLGRMTAAGFAHVNGAARYSEYGVRLGAFWTMPQGLQLGVEIPYLITKSQPTYTYAPADGSSAQVIETRRSIGGFAGLVSVGLRF